MEDFIIDDPSWHTAERGSLDSREQVREFFLELFKFLRDHNLLTREVALSSRVDDAELVLKRSDLTDEGFKVIQSGWEKLEGSRNRRTGKRNFDMLMKALKKVRG